MLARHPSTMLIGQESPYVFFAPANAPPLRELTRHAVRLSMYSSKWTTPNGNCMFEAFGRAVNDAILPPSVTRTAAVQWIDANRDAALDRLSTAQTLDKYLTEMAQDGTWGEDLAMFALCEAYKVGVDILKKDGTRYIWNQVGDRTNNRRIITLYLEAEHYENLYTVAEAGAGRQI